MGDEFGTKAGQTARRYSNSAVLDATDFCERSLDDLVSTNNHRNEKLNEMAEHEDGDEIDEDWLSKLTHARDGVRVPSHDESSSPFPYGLNCQEIPLLCDENLDFKEKTMRTIRVGLKKFWRRGSVTITAEDPTYKVAYLGNVLTGWAKGEGCIDKPLNTLWKNYNSSTKPDVQMKITVTQSGLKAVTRDHGLIEYWSNRITYCTVPPNLPRVFCWVYRHEGRKLKQELRCHAVLCAKDSVAARMAATLRLRLSQALLEFKRIKLLRQNARLSLANSVYDNPSLPRRKILLSTGSYNYKPPLERSKSAPRLTIIEESLEEEESTPKAKRKFEKEKEEEEEEEEEEEARPSNPSADEKCEYKLSNLNFVKKLCSSIENLVESTSNYSKKFLAERKSPKEVYLAAKKPEESILKKGEEDGGRSRSRKNVTFYGSEGPEFARCTEYRKPEEEEEAKAVEDQESDEGSNSLQSISSCCSDVSSLVTNSSDKSAELNELDHLEGCDSPMERLRAYLSSYGSDFLEGGGKVMVHPTGEEPASLEDVGSEEEDEDAAKEEDVVSDESGFVDLGESLAKRLSLDSKEKDLPYHRIIKSTMLRPGRTKSSCLHV